MLLAFVIGYILGLIFFAGYFYLLISHVKRTGRRPSKLSLFVAYWIVMPVLVVVGCMIVFGEIDSNALLSVIGYAASRVVKQIRVMIGWSMSNDEILDLIVHSAQHAQAVDNETEDYFQRMRK